MYGAIYRQAYRERPKSTRWSEAGLVGDDTENLDLDLQRGLRDLDGNGDDWAALRGQQQCFTADVVADESPARLCVLLARYGGALHLLADVDDATVVREPRRGDALRLLIDDGGVRAYRFSSQEGRLGMVAEDEHPLPAIRGEWAERDGGYRVELRFPPGWQARRIGIEALDRTSVDGNAIRIGSAPDRLGGLWPLAQRDDDLGRRIGRLVPPGLHVRLLSLDGWVLADAGKLAQVRGGPLPARCNCAEAGR